MFNSVGGASQFQASWCRTSPWPSGSGGPYSGPSWLVGTAGQNGNGSRKCTP